MAFSSLANWDGRLSQPPPPTPSDTPPPTGRPALAQSPAHSSDVRVAQPESSVAPLPPLGSASGTPSIACMSSGEDEERVSTMLLEASPSPLPMKTVSSPPFTPPRSPRYPSEDLAATDVEGMDSLLSGKAVLAFDLALQRDALEVREETLGGRSQTAVETRVLDGSAKEAKDRAESEALSESVTVADSNHELAPERDLSPVLRVSESPLSSAHSTPQRRGEAPTPSHRPLLSRPGGALSRSPSVEIIENAPGGQGMGETALLAVAARQTSTNVHNPQQPSHSAGQPTGRARAGNVFSSSSLSPPPQDIPSRVSSVLPKPPRVYVELPTLPPWKKKKYFCLSDMRRRSIHGLEESSRPARVAVSTTRHDRHTLEYPLSPTVSDLERLSPRAPSRNESPIVISSDSSPTPPRTRVSPSPRARPKLFKEGNQAGIQSFEEGLVAAIRASTTVPSVDADGNPSSIPRRKERAVPRMKKRLPSSPSPIAGPSRFLERRSTSPPPSVAPLVPLKRKPASPPPIAGPSRPPKRQQTENISQPPALSTISPRVESPVSSPAHTSSTEDSSTVDTWVTYGLGDDAIDIVGQFSTYYDCEIDTSERYIEKRIPDPQQLHAVLASSLRHIFASVGIDPASLYPSHKPPVASSQHHVQEELSRTVVRAREQPPPVDDDDDGYESPARIWNEIQDAIARNAAPPTPPRRKRGRPKSRRPPSTPYTEHVAVESLREPQGSIETNVNAAPPTDERPEVPSLLSSLAVDSGSGPQDIQPAPTTMPNPPSIRHDAGNQYLSMPHSEVQPSQSLSYDYVHPQDNFLTNVVRGYDAFFGGHMGIDHDMGMGMHEPFASGPSLSPDQLTNHEMYAGSSQWMGPSQPLPSAFDTNTHIDNDHAPPPPTVSMNAVYPAGSGTIDPSLLAPATPARPLMSTPTPTPPSASSHCVPVAESVHDEDADEWVPHTKPKPKAKSTTSGKGKGKGKQRAADVGYRARMQREESSSVVSGMHEDPDVPPEGKRARKLSRRALQAREFGIDFDELDRRKAKGRPAAPERDESDDDGNEDKEDFGISESKIRQLALEIPFCHQCRGRNRYNKMRCSVLKDSQPCGLYFCEKCIWVRYKDIEFNTYAANFKCPKCLGTCNCTACCKHRGEPYVSTKGAKLDEIEYSSLYANIPLNKEPAKESAQPAKARKTVHKTATPAPPSIAPPAQPKPSTKPQPKPFTLTQKEREIAAKMALPAGAIWGTVYGLDMDRLGVGVVADGRAQNVVIRQDPNARPPYSFPRGTYYSSSDEDEDEESDDSEDTNFVELPVHEPGPIVAPPVPAQPPPEIRKRTSRHFIGKLQRDWTLLPDKMAGLGAKPEQAAFAGSKDVVVAHYERRGIDIVRRSTAPDMLNTCLYGDLTPEPEDDNANAEEGDAEHNMKVGIAKIILALREAEAERGMMKAGEAGAGISQTGLVLSEKEQTAGPSTTVLNTPFTAAFGPTTIPVNGGTLPPSDTLPFSDVLSSNDGLPLDHAIDSDTFPVVLNDASQEALPISSTSTIIPESFKLAVDPTSTWSG